MERPNLETRWIMLGTDGQDGLRLDPSLELLVQPFDGVRNRYRILGAEA